MFTKGQKVRPVFKTKDDEQFFSSLKTDRIYHVLEYNPPNECAKRWPEKTYYQEHVGRVVVEEMPTLEWFGDRFAPVEN